ncbi:hypothetical protein [Aureibaculum marinum]|uniref:hypothetical protein n=1 Tax=Aureibaculum marinum TaxID=2487930 RepID=UPI0013966A0D|nr:hypothetical protein [Aureibaculum marinum]
MIGLEDTLELTLFNDDENLDDDEEAQLEAINQVLINEFKNKPDAKGKKKC